VERAWWRVEPATWNEGLLGLVANRWAQGAVAGLEAWIADEEGAVVLWGEGPMREGPLDAMAAFAERVVEVAGGTARYHDDFDAAGPAFPTPAGVRLEEHAEARWAPASLAADHPVPEAWRTPWRVPERPAAATEGPRAYFILEQTRLSPTDLREMARSYRSAHHPDVRAFVVFEGETYGPRLYGVAPLFDAGATHALAVLGHALRKVGWGGTLLFTHDRHTRNWPEGWAPGLGTDLADFADNEPLQVVGSGEGPPWPWRADARNHSKVAPDIFRDAT